jgi:eukaryotic-like serine/threonine-protein kinase
MRYRLKQRIAEGGIGDVWLAEHLHLKQNVAIKFLKEGLTADPEAARSALERFRFESQVSAMLALRTPYVVKVHDAGDSEAGPFLAMEFVPGRSLAEELRTHGPMNPARLGAILEQVANALGAAHAAGIVHRDIKPANILVCDEPGGSLSVKLVDFGIAKTTNLRLPLDRPKDTGVTAMMGTPGFMSPEQLQGGRAHPTMDVWALGVVAYKLLTNTVPFPAESTTDMVDKVLNEPFPPPSSRRSGLPIALDAWFSRALAKDPADRFATPKEMCEAYRAALDVDADSWTDRSTMTLEARLAKIAPPAKIAPSADTAETAVEGRRWAPPRLGAIEPTTLASERPTGRFGRLADTARASGSWFGAIVATALAMLLAAALLITRAGRDPLPQETFAQRSDLQRICPPTNGASPALAPAHGLPEPDGASAQRSHPPPQQPSRAIPIGDLPARSVPVITPPPAPPPATSPLPSDEVPARNPSNVL